MMVHLEKQGGKIANTINDYMFIIDRLSRNGFCKR